MGGRHYNYTSLKNINKSLKEIKQAGYKLPTLTGALRASFSMFIDERKGSPTMGLLLKRREAYLQAKKINPNIRQKDVTAQYNKLIGVLQTHMSKYYGSVEKYRETNRQRLLDILYNDLNVDKDLPLEDLAKIEQLSYDDLLELFNKSANATSKDSNGRFADSQEDSEGWKHYNEFSANLKEILDEMELFI